MPTKQGFGVNLALLIGVSLPCIAATYFLRTECPALAKQPSSNWWDLSNICKLGIEHPVWALNVIYFINVNVIFWIISLWQDSTWLIDPYWTIIPVLIAHFYHAHPTAQYDPMRARVVLALVWIWSIRLTHSYFRREEWKLGAREDWRFADMRKDYGKHWWWISFFACYISQHVMLVGITLPFYAVFSSAAPFTNSDWLIAAAALGFIVLAYFADTQLREFMQTNENRAKAGKSKILILKTGVWRWSRHPNYFGELSWWWTVAFFGLQLASPVYFAGTIANTAAMAVVTYMVEKRMSAVKERLAAWNAYKAITSVWVPLPLFVLFKEQRVSPAKSPAKAKGPAKASSSPKRAVNKAVVSPAKAKPSPKKSQSPRRQKTA